MALSAVVLVACGGSPPASETTATISAVTASLAISGTVTGATGLPVAGVAVTLSGGQQATHATDAGGAYTFQVSPGSYSLAASGICAAFTPAVANLNGVQGNTVQNFSGSGGSCGTPANSGATTGTLTISGQVTVGGLAAPGVRVNLSGGAQAYRTTDSTGAYSFAVNPGSYSLSASREFSSFTPSVVNLNDIATSQRSVFVGGSASLGAPCANNAACASGSCTDGVCCTTGSCGSLCRACNLPASPGVCADRPAGTDCTSCTGEFFAPGTCDAAGTCAEGIVRACAPYNCSSPVACGTSCAGDLDCAPGNHCQELSGQPGSCIQ